MRVKNQKITFSNTDGAIEQMLVLHPVKQNILALMQNL